MYKFNKVKSLEIFGTVATKLKEFCRITAEDVDSLTAERKTLLTSYLKKPKAGETTPAPASDKEIKALVASRLTFDRDYPVFSEYNLPAEIMNHQIFIDICDCWKIKIKSDSNPFLTFCSKAEKHIDDNMRRLFHQPEGKAKQVKALNDELSTLSMKNKKHLPQIETILDKLKELS